MIFEKIDKPYNEKDVYNYLLETYKYCTSWTSVILKNRSLLFNNDKPTEFLINQIKIYHECGYSYNELMLSICAYYWLYKYWNFDIIGLSFLSLEKINNVNNDENEFIDDSEYDNGIRVMHENDIPKSSNRLSKGNGGHTPYWDEFLLWKTNNLNKNPNDFVEYILEQIHN